MIGDHLQKQADGLAVVRDELHEETRVVAELGSPIGRGGQFLQPGGGEVVAAKPRAQPFERLREAAGAEVAVGDDSHSAIVRQLRADRAALGKVTQRLWPLERRFGRCRDVDSVKRCDAARFGGDPATRLPFAEGKDRTFVFSALFSP